MKFPKNKVLRLTIIICAIFAVIIFYPSYMLIKGYYCLYSAETELLTPKQVGKARLEVYGNIPVLHVYGSPEEIGKQYGELIKKPFVSILSALSMFLSDGQRKYFHKQARIIEKNLPENLRTELKAVSKATGVPYMDLVAVNVTPELHCSCLAAWGKATKDGSMIMGRNLDYNISVLSNITGLITVYHFDKGNPVVSINFLGMIGCFTGINSKGLAFGNMLVYNASGKRFNPDGMSIQLLLREAAQNCSDTNEFNNYLKKLQHVIPMNVMVVDPKQAEVLEIGSEEFGTRKPKDGDNFIAASNHFKLRSLRRREVSCGRYNRFVKSVEDNFGKIDNLLMREFLYRSRIPDLNLQAVVFEPEKMLMHVALNSTTASKGPYITFDVKKLIEGKENPVLMNGEKPVENNFIKQAYGKDK